MGFNSGFKGLASFVAFLYLVKTRHHYQQKYKFSFLRLGNIVNRTFISRFRTACINKKRIFAAALFVSKVMKNYE